MEIINSNNMETEQFRRSVLQINPNLSEAYVSSLKLNDYNLLGKYMYYYRTYSNLKFRFVKMNSLIDFILETLNKDYRLPEIETSLKPDEKSAQQFGFSSNYILGKYFYTINLDHNLETHIVTLDPYKWDNGYQEGTVDMKSFTVPYGDKEALEKAIKEAVSYLESYSPINEKYRSFPENRRKIIEKWRKENADDPRTKIDIAEEKEIIQINN